MHTILFIEVQTNICEAFLRIRVLKSRLKIAQKKQMLNLRAIALVRGKT